MASYLPYEDEGYMRMVLNAVPLKERYDVAANLSKAFPNLEYPFQVMENMDTYIKYAPWCFEQILDRRFSTPIVTKYGITIKSYSYFWVIEDKTVYTDIPANLPTVRNGPVLNRLVYGEDAADPDRVLIEWCVAPEPSTLFHALPVWSCMYDIGIAEPYNVTFTQKFLSMLEEFAIDISITLNTTKDNIHHFTMCLKVNASENMESMPEYIMEGERTWDFSYNTKTQEIIWTLPEDEVAIMFPPPAHKLISSRVPAPNAACFTAYTDRTCIRHCNPPGCPMSAYQITLSVEMLNKILMGDL